MSRPLLLDLFCCEGGAAMGYHRAGFDVIGVDIVPQPRYPFPFIQADALNPPFNIWPFDAIHASPPCQAYSVTRYSHSKEHPDVVAATRQLLEVSGLPWVIENVPGAPLRSPVTVCGASLNLTATDVDGDRLVLRRHREFESNVYLMTYECACRRYRREGVQIGGVYGGGRSDRNNSWTRGGYTPPKAQRAELIGCDHMTMHGLSQAVPPAYTEHIGQQLLTHLAAST